MKIRVLSLLFAIALPLGVSAAEEAPAATATPKPSLLQRLNPFGGGKKDKKGAKGQVVLFKQLEMNLLVEPNPVKLGENRQMKVTFTLINRGSKMTQLEFPTSQRVEVLVKKAGETIEQWSQDQAFNNDPTMVTINPNERLEYSINVATRDMVAGETYSVEGFFPNFDPLRKIVSVTAK